MRILRNGVPVEVQAIARKLHHAVALLDEVDEDTYMRLLPIVCSLAQDGCASATALMRASVDPDRDAWARDQMHEASVQIDRDHAGLVEHRLPSEALRLLVGDLELRVSVVQDGHNQTPHFVSDSASEGSGIGAVLGSSDTARGGT